MDDQTGKESAYADRASKGGEARMKKLSREERSDLAREAAKARWKRVKSKELIAEAGIEPSRVNSLPEAKWPGILNLVGVDIPVYVLSNGQKVIARIAATEVLTGIKRQGDLESYLRAESLKGFIDIDSIKAEMVTFRQKDVEMLNQTVMGLSSDLFIEICRFMVWRAIWRCLALDSSSQMAPSAV